MFGTLALVAAALFVVAAESQPPEGKDKGDRGGERGKGPGGRGDRGPRDKGGPGRMELGRVLPPFVREQLELSELQEQAITKLEAEVKEKLEKILTPEQKKQLENMRPPRGGFGGPGGRGGPGGPGGPGDGPPDDRGPGRGRDKAGDRGPRDKGGDRPGRSDRPERPNPDEPPPPPPPPDGDQVKADAPAEAIQWFATLEAGRAEAARTGKPILFLSAAPHCGGVSGIW